MFQDSLDGQICTCGLSTDGMCCGNCPYFSNEKPFNPESAIFIELIDKVEECIDQYWTIPPGPRHNLLRKSINKLVKVANERSLKLQKQPTFKTMWWAK